MSNINRGVTTFKQEQQTLEDNHNQRPTPEPRRKLRQKNDLPNRDRFNPNHPAESDKNTFNDDREHIATAKLVKVRNIQTQNTSDDAYIYREPQKRTSFNDTRMEFASDEGVGSPTNIDYDDEEELADEYYDDEGDFEQTDELSNLSRQSMMPLHELIAYYHYIQQGSDDQGAARETVSRQSSSVSQQTTKTKHSSSEDTVDNYNSSDVIQDEKYNQIRREEREAKELEEDLAYNSGKPIPRMQVPQVLVENFGDAGKGSHLIEDSSQKEETISASTRDKRRIRANVILELINSERDYVKHLKDVVEGYLYPARRHPEIFTGERINTIFSNIEQIYEFQRKFLDSLESCINRDDLAASEVGHCFLEYENGFSVYHYYCNNHPNAISELQDLYTKKRVVNFFEVCRERQKMIDISLDGFLLTPIQKICKYPLQLNELLKNTNDDHPDFESVANALESMRNCANLANERKRRIEALADIMLFQEKVEGWFGPKLSDTSSILIHSGEVSRITSHNWISQKIHLYLFDHLLLLSRKDLLKRNVLILEARICMDTVTEICDADDKRKGFKLYCHEQQKWFVFTSRSEKEKEEWIKAFERERNLVESDINEGFHITDREIGVARKALQNRKRSRSARYRHKRPDTAIVDQLDIDDPYTIMNRTLSLPSCIHPSHVMNFVEDSRVVSTRKKNNSPNSSPRSPTSSYQHITEQENPQQSSGNWFKKMGSKKLAKSQVYNVNGTGSSNAKSQTVSPTVGGTFEPINLNGPTKYDQLEKRHRDHMVSEEQARLFRLNNDLPPPSFAVTTKSPTSTQSSMKNRQQQLLNPTSIKQSQRRHSQPQGDGTLSFGSNEPPNFQSLISNEQDHDEQYSRASLMNQDGQFEDMAERGTFETTVVLSSGRVVRVREDAV